MELADAALIGDGEVGGGAEALDAVEVDVAHQDGEILRLRFEGHHVAVLELGSVDRIHPHVGADIPQQVVLGQFVQPGNGFGFFRVIGLGPPEQSPVTAIDLHAAPPGPDLTNRIDGLDDLSAQESDPIQPHDPDNEGGQPARKILAPRAGHVGCDP
jgi:hypothetical protein